MLVKERYTLTVVVIVGCLLLLLSACTPEEIIKTVEITVPSEEVIIQVEVTSPPEFVEVTVEVPVAMPAEEDLGLYAGCTYNAYGLGWVMDYADAENVLNVVFHPDSPFQYTSWDDEAFRDFVDQAQMEFDPEVRARLWQQVEDILVTDYAVVIPFYHYDRNAMVQPEIETEYPPFGSPHFSKWRLPEGQTTLQVPLRVDPPTLDPTLDSVLSLILAQVMEGLYRFRGDGTIEPAGAESCEVSEDGTTYTIKLRQDAVWSDGEPVIAQHYVDSIIRLLSPATAAEYAWQAYYILGAEAYNTGEVSDPSTVGVRAVDDYTLEIVLERPVSYFDSNLPLFAPIRLDVIARYGDLWTEPGNFVGDGPYALVEWVHEDHLVIEKNPIYHSADEVTIDRVEFPIIYEETTALIAYKLGDLDVYDYPSEELPRLLEEMPDHFVRLPHPGVAYMGLNLRRPPTDNVNFRKALASAIDMRAILDNVLNVPWRVEACGVIPPEIAGYQGCGNVGFEYDPVAAREYLRMAMEEMGIDDPGDISINFWGFRGVVEDVGEPVIDQLETNLGIEVHAVSMEWAAYLETLSSCRH